MTPRFALGALLATICGAALAQSAGGEFAVTRSVVAGGTARSSGGGFTLTATAGQPEAGTMTGTGFRVTGGFWPQAVAPAQIFRNGFE